MEEIIIRNEDILKQVRYKLDKIDNDFKIEDILKINELVLDLENQNEYDYSFIDELSIFNNLESLTVRNGFIYNDDYRILTKLDKLESIAFYNCEFENADLISSLNLKDLSLIKCDINSYLFVCTLSNLLRLSISGGDINIGYLNKLNELLYLNISYCNILDMDHISINSLQEINISNTNIFSLDFVRDLNNIKYLSIDENQFNYNKNVIKELIDKDVIVLNEDMVEFGVDE